MRRVGRFDWAAGWSSGAEPANVAVFEIRIASANSSTTAR